MTSRLAVEVRESDWRNTKRNPMILREDFAVAASLFSLIRIRNGPVYCDICERKLAACLIQRRVVVVLVRSLFVYFIFSHCF